MNRTGNNTTGWARRLTALLITACLVMAMALPVYAEVNPLPDVPGEVELLEDEPGTASGEDTIEQLPDANAPPKQEAATPVPEAAAPEPEQSAEPEQPAPTETPEPTAEPTLTPEPTATATATPVPTVTPTATPEPTEQPQKMYAARSVDNVQAVSEGGNTETYTLYFAVPKSWSDCTRVIIYAVATNDTTKDPYTLEMQEDGKTGDGRKIYSADLNKDKHYPYGGLNGLEFHGYKGDTPVDEVVIADVNANPRTWWKTFDPNDKEHYIGGNYYDPEAEGEEWSTYTVTVRHDDFAGKEMVFENKTSDETLTNVKACFYEPDKNNTGKLIQVDEQPISLNDIQPNSTEKFNIPSVLCSYVQFTWNEGDSQKYSKIYNFYGEEVSGDDEKSFKYSDTSNCFIYTGAGNERWGIENSVLIYYDATFSKLPTTGTNDTDGDYSIPKALKADQSTENKVYYCLKGENGKKSIAGEMSRIGSTDYYAADVPDGYTKIVFSSYQLSSDENLSDCGNNTDWVDIPLDYKDKEQCFYADTNDDTIYHSGPRGGYWAPKDTPRDAETWKNKNTDPKVEVVDIASAPFTEEANTKYVTSTLYDYYTDYELNGKNRDDYGSYTDASHRNWVPFREFDQALSDYYEKAGAQYPLYTGHFQPAGTAEFSQIADTLKLFGYDKFKRFMAINNSQYNEDSQNNDNNHTYYAYQGLVANKTSTGKATGEPLLKGTEIVEPHFNKDFLSGENSKKAKLGEVYENVKFPFTKVRNLFDNETDVDYWCFDSKDTTLYLKQDSGQNSDSKYFLQSAKNRESSKNVSASSNSKDPYGYFPFNETANPGVFSTYNYGFGTKLQMDFTLTDDGMVEADGKNGKTNIKFFFSGDDDVWVFIDGKLALDVGGAHGEVSGLLEFGKADEKNNSVTAYVSRVKTGGTSGSDKDDKNGNLPVKAVTYKGEPINFYAQGTTLNDLGKGKKHTLTMYYMERGMWESNMAVAFNFPDNNELQVQKEVKLDNVNPAFQNCFKNQKIFNFTIQNQATHYGETDAAEPDTGGVQSKVVDLTANGDNTFEPATKQTESNKGDYIFELATNPEHGSGQDAKKVLHWYARYPDTEPVSYWRKQRYGILTLKDPINIEKMRFLTFQVYVGSNDGGELSLNNLYLELLDNQDLLEPPKSPGQKGSLGTTGINGATYGSVELVTNKWVTVKLDLYKMKEQGGFNNYVKTIRVGDNYNRNIYFRDFTFIPKVVPSKMTGFTTDQEKIPDYHSVESGKLENAENAQYTSNMDTDTQLVDEDGRFVLEDGEIVTFSDQFRRGSYISLKEDLNPKLYDTTWTVCENGRAVTSMEKGDSVSLSESPPSLSGQKGSGPDDGRTENIRADDNQQNNKYDEKKPSATDRDANTIVFRSYNDPDETSSTLTKLKVKYVNTVKTGGLKIQKKAADGEKDTIKGTYTFKVTFNNVGGEGLEDGDIIREYTIDMSDTKNPDHICTITGIPVGTRYTIEEVKPEDQSRLQSVTVPADCKSAHLIKNNTMVEGVIEKSEDPKNPELTAIFTNTQRKLINIEFDKHWIDAENKELKNQPSEIYIQLQRRPAGSKNDADWQAVEYAGSEYVMVPHTDGGWKRTFSGLDQYKINDDKTHTDYEYRIVEGTVTGTGGNSKFTQANGTITINDSTYVVTAKAEAKISDGDGTKPTTATVNGGTITGDSGTIVLTNKLQNPKFVLDIIKQDANDEKTLLDGVEFKLEKLVKNEGETQWKVDNSYPFNNTNTGSITAITGKDGKITGVFKDLKPGRYRLTETKAHEGYNLLSKPIDIEFTQDGMYKIDDGPAQKATGDAASGYTVTLPVLNRKTPELPHTGADAPSLWLLIGLPLAVAGLLIFTFRYNRKGGRRH